MSSDRAKSRAEEGTAHSSAWEVAKDVRTRDEECHAALQAALSAARLLDQHLEQAPAISVPDHREGTSVSSEWYATYRELSASREAAFRSFEACAERELGHSAALGR